MGYKGYDPSNQLTFFSIYVIFHGVKPFYKPISTHLQGERLFKADVCLGSTSFLERIKTVAKSLKPTIVANFIEPIAIAKTILA